MLTIIITVLLLTYFCQIFAAGFFPFRGEACIKNVELNLTLAAPSRPQGQQMTSNTVLKLIGSVVEIIAIKV